MALTQAGAGIEGSGWRTVPRTTWHRLLAFGRRWPRLYRRAHLVAIVLLPLELLTGACLYFPGLHTALIPWLPLIEFVHTWFGVAFGVMLLLPVAVPVGRRALSVLDWTLLSWTIGALAVSGLVLWVGFDVWPVLRAGAFGLHGLVAVLVAGWLVYHGVLRWLTAARRGDIARVGSRRLMPRRELALNVERAVLAGIFGSAIFGVLFDVRAPVTSGSTTGAGAAAPGAASADDSPPLPGFQLYTVAGYYPAFDPTTYRLVVDGAVATPLSLSLQDLTGQIPQVDEVRNFRCVTGWEVPDVHWQGVRVADLLKMAGAEAGAAWLTFHSFDGVYTDSLSIKQATADGVLLVHHADGRPIARQQGAPLRLYVPQMYGYKSVKWLARIEVAKSEALGYWEQRGYGPNAYLGTDDGWPPGQFPHFW